MPAASASPAHDAAIRAVAGLLTSLRLEFVFVGAVAGSAWLGRPAASGSIDAVVLMGPQQKNSVATMAANRGFTVEPEEIEATEELDLIPLTFGGIRVHVLVASNALYGRMVADGVPVDLGGLQIRIPRIEDFAILLQMSNDAGGVSALSHTDGFDRDAYNRKLTSIGLRSLVLPE